jgi:hypothetical protein
MPASTAISAFGTLLQIGDGAVSEAFTTVGEVTDLSGPKRSMSIKKFLTHSSPGAAMEAIGVSIDNGSVTFTTNYVPTNATHVKLLADQAAFTKRNFKMVLPDAGNTTWCFTALVKDFDPSEKPGEVLEAKWSLELSGQIT